jgi:hypothetical protein
VVGDQVPRQRPDRRCRLPPVHGGIDIDVHARGRYSGSSSACH